MARNRDAVAKKRLIGTARSDRTRPRDPAARLSSCPPPPAHLAERAKQEWQQLAPIAHRLGTLTECDVKALELLATTLATAAEAQETLKLEGITIKSASGATKCHPAAAVMRDARAQAARLLAEFGLTPRSRSGIDRAPAAPPAPPADPADKYFT